MGIFINENILKEYEFKFFEPDEKPKQKILEPCGDWAPMIDDLGYRDNWIRDHVADYYNDDDWYDFDK